MTDVLRQVEALARAELDFEGELKPDMRLVEDLDLDSIRLLMLATAVEDHFRIALDEDDEASIETVGELVDLIQKKNEQKESDPE